MRTNHHTRARSGKAKLDLAGVQVVGTEVATDTRVAIVASRFNASIVESLVQGALRALGARGIAMDQVTLVWVPGAWELPAAARLLIEAEAADAIVALGCVIRGETAHFDVIVNESARGLMQVGLEFGVPVANGVLACENESQALERAGEGADNKGAEAAEAALQMSALFDVFADEIADRYDDAEAAR